MNDSTPADLRSAIEEAFLAENGVVEMLMVEINAAAGNLDYLRSLPRGVFEACDSNQDQECNSPSQARFKVTEVSSLLFLTYYHQGTSNKFCLVSIPILLWVEKFC